MPDILERMVIDVIYDNHPEQLEQIKNTVTEMTNEVNMLIEDTVSNASVLNQKLEYTNELAQSSNNLNEIPSKNVTDYGRYRLKELGHDDMEAESIIQDVIQQSTDFRGRTNPEDRNYEPISGTFERYLTDYVVEDYAEQFKPSRRQELIDQYFSLREPVSGSDRDYVTQQLRQGGVPESQLQAATDRVIQHTQDYRAETAWEGTSGPFVDDTRFEIEDYLKLNKDSFEMLSKDVTDYGRYRLKQIGHNDLQTESILQDVIQQSTDFRGRTNPEDRNYEPISGTFERYLTDYVVEDYAEQFKPEQRRGIIDQYFSLREPVSGSDRDYVTQQLRQGGVPEAQLQAATDRVIQHTQDYRAETAWEGTSGPFIDDTGFEIEDYLKQNKVSIPTDEILSKDVMDYGRYRLKELGHDDMEAESILQDVIQQSTDFRGRTNPEDRNYEPISGTFERYLTDYVVEDYAEQFKPEQRRGIIDQYFSLREPVSGSDRDYVTQQLRQGGVPEAQLQAATDRVIQHTQDYRAETAWEGTSGPFIDDTGFEIEDYLKRNKVSVPTEEILSKDVIDYGRYRLKELGIDDVESESVLQDIIEQSTDFRGRTNPEDRNYEPISGTFERYLTDYVVEDYAEQFKPEQRRGIIDQYFSLREPVSGSDRDYVTQQLRQGGVPEAQLQAATDRVIQHTQDYRAETAWEGTSGPFIDDTGFEIEDYLKRNKVSVPTEEILSKDVIDYGRYRLKELGIDDVESESVLQDIIEQSTDFRGRTNPEDRNYEPISGTFERYLTDYVVEDYAEQFKPEQRRGIIDQYFSLREPVSGSDRDYVTQQLRQGGVPEAQLQAATDRVIQHTQDYRAETAWEGTSGPFIDDTGFEIEDYLKQNKVSIPTDEILSKDVMDYGRYRLKELGHDDMEAESILQDVIQQSTDFRGRTNPEDRNYEPISGTFERYLTDYVVEDYAEQFKPEQRRGIIDQYFSLREPVSGSDRDYVTQQLRQGGVPESQLQAATDRVIQHTQDYRAETAWEGTSGPFIDDTGFEIEDYLKRNKADSMSGIEADTNISNQVTANTQPMQDNRTYEFNIPITVETSDSDPHGIGQNIGFVLKDEIRNALRSADSQIAR